MTIVDEFTRECPAIEVDTSITGQRVVRVLDRLSETHGLPQTLVLDNGPEFTSKALKAWAQRSGVRLHFITPGKPEENGYIESFNGKFRDECLNLHWFQDLADFRMMIEDWRTDYNRDRPHCPASTILAGLASIIFAGSPPLPGPAAGLHRCGSWGRQTPG